MDRLATYRTKRQFEKTPEPEGTRGKSSLGGLYVIHEHDATRLHYDLRLEHDGVLLSWAVTRGPSLDPEEKRLAVQVEDHPIDYGAFEGTIPEGNYGAGTVSQWDRGRWIPEGDPAAGLKRGRLNFHLEGEKLKGGWHLVRMVRRPKEKRDSWLLIKSKDQYAISGAKGEVTKTAMKSVKTGRTLAEIAAGRKAKPREAASRKPAKAPVKATKTAKTEIVLSHPDRVLWPGGGPDQAGAPRPLCRGLGMVEALCDRPAAVAVAGAGGDRRQPDLLPEAEVDRPRVFTIAPPAAAPRCARCTGHAGASELRGRA